MNRQRVTVLVSITVGAVASFLCPLGDRYLTMAEIASIRGTDPDDCKAPATYEQGVYCTVCEARQGYSGQWITCNKDDPYTYCAPFSGGPPCRACFDITPQCSGYQQIYYTFGCTGDHDDLQARCAYLGESTVTHPCSVYNMPCP
jgi:hypothetical protein